MSSLYLPSLPWSLWLCDVGCPTGWLRFRTDCYKYHNTEQKLFHPAETDCVKEGAHVSSVLDSAENDFLVSLAAGSYVQVYTPLINFYIKINGREYSLTLPSLLGYILWKYGFDNGEIMNVPKSFTGPLKAFETSQLTPREA